MAVPRKRSAGSVVDACWCGVMGPGRGKGVQGHGGERGVLCRLACTQSPVSTHSLYIHAPTDPRIQYTYPYMYVHTRSTDLFWGGREEEGAVRHCVHNKPTGREGKEGMCVRHRSCGWWDALLHGNDDKGKEVSAARGGGGSCLRFDMQTYVLHNTSM